jgi:hypothetical protein
MATRLDATFEANSKRMNRNSTRMSSDTAYNKGKPATEARFTRLEQLKRLPRGKAASETWRPSKRSKDSGR